MAFCSQGTGQAAYYKGEENQLCDERKGGICHGEPPILCQVVLHFPRYRPIVYPLTVLHNLHTCTLTYIV